MPTWVEIIDAGDERVAVYRNQRDAWLRAQRGEVPSDRAAGLFMAEGELVVRALIDVRWRTHSVLVGSWRVPALRPLLDALPPEVPVYIAPRSSLEEIVGFDLHRGVLAAAHRPALPQLRELCAQRRVLVMLEDLTNHDNLGSLFRSTAALAGAGAAGIVLSPRCADPLYRKAVRVSMGAVTRVPWTVADEWPGAIEEVRRAGFEVIAMTPDPGAEPVASVGLGERGSGARRLALLFGAEGPGLSAAARKAADRHVRIPIDPAVDSLNVAVAGAIALDRLARPALSAPASPGTRLLPTE